MNETSLTITPFNEVTNPWVKTIAGQLDKIEQGRLSITLPNGQTLHFGEGGLHACVVLNNYTPLSKFLLHGDIALAESYMDGDWKCPDLTALFDLALANEEDYDVFMAIVEKVGKDRRGNPIYIRDEDGAEMLFEEIKRYLIKGEERSRTEKNKRTDDDLPKTAKAYCEFLNEV